MVLDHELPGSGLAVAACVIDWCVTFNNNCRVTAVLVTVKS